MTERFAIRLATSTVLCCLLAQPVWAQKGGKGGKPETPTGPQVVFRLRQLPRPLGAVGVNIEDMNDQLRVVGGLSNTVKGDIAYLYDYVTDTMLTIDDLLSPQDLAALSNTGWTQSRFTGINSWDLVVGYLTNSNETMYRSMLVDLRNYDPTSSPPSSAALYLPEFAGIENSGLRAVNGWGDVVGVHVAPVTGVNTPFVFNPGLYAPGLEYQPRILGAWGQYYNTWYATNTVTEARTVMLKGAYGSDAAEYDVVTDDDPVSIDSGASVWHLYEAHDSGSYLGSEEVVVQKKRSQRPIVVSLVDGNWQVVWSQNVAGAAQAMNSASQADLALGFSQGDILTREAGSPSRSYLYVYSPQFGRLHLDSLVDPAQLTQWQGLRPDSQIMTEKRPDTNFGAIADFYGWMLVPYPSAF